MEAEDIISSAYNTLHDDVDVPPNESNCQKTSNQRNNEIHEPKKLPADFRTSDATNHVTGNTKRGTYQTFSAASKYRNECANKAYYSPPPPPGVVNRNLSGGNHVILNAIHSEKGMHSALKLQNTDISFPHAIRVSDITSNRDTFASVSNNAIPQGQNNLEMFWRRKVIEMEKTEDQISHKSSDSDSKNKYVNLSARIATTLRNLLQKQPAESPVKAKKIFKHDGDISKPTPESLSSVTPPDIIDVSKVLKIVTKPTGIEEIKTEKYTTRPQLKTYCNRRKKSNQPEIVESFGLPDEPIIPLNNTSSVPILNDLWDVSTCAASSDINLKFSKNIWDQQQYVSKNFSLNDEIRVKNSSTDECGSSLNKRQSINKNDHIFLDSHEKSKFVEFFCEDDTTREVNCGIQSVDKLNEVLDIIDQKRYSEPRENTKSSEQLRSPRSVCCSKVNNKTNLLNKDVCCDQNSKSTTADNLPGIAGKKLVEAKSNQKQKQTYKMKVIKITNMHIPANNPSCGPSAVASKSWSEVSTEELNTAIGNHTLKQEHSISSENQEILGYLTHSGIQDVSANVTPSVNKVSSSDRKLRKSKTLTSLDSLESPNCTNRNEEKLSSKSKSELSLDKQFFTEEKSLIKTQTHGTNCDNITLNRETKSDQLVPEEISRRSMRSHNKVDGTSSDTGNSNKLIKLPTKQSKISVSDKKIQQANFVHDTLTIDQQSTKHQNDSEETSRSSRKVTEVKIIINKLDKEFADSKLDILNSDTKCSDVSNPVGDGLETKSMDMKQSGDMKISNSKNNIGNLILQTERNEVSPANDLNSSTAKIDTICNIKETVKQNEGKPSLRKTRSSLKGTESYSLNVQNKKSVINEDVRGSSEGIKNLDFGDIVQNSVEVSTHMTYSSEEVDLNDLNVDINILPQRVHSTELLKKELTASNSILNLSDCEDETRDNLQLIAAHRSSRRDKIENTEQSSSISNRGQSSERTNVTDSSLNPSNEGNPASKPATPLRRRQHRQSKLPKKTNTTSSSSDLTKEVVSSKGTYKEKEQKIEETAATTLNSSTANISDSEPTTAMKKGRPSKVNSFDKSASEILVESNLKQNVTASKAKKQLHELKSTEMDKNLLQENNSESNPSTPRRSSRSRKEKPAASNDCFHSDSQVNVNRETAKDNEVQIDEQKSSEIINVSAVLKEGNLSSGPTTPLKRGRPRKEKISTPDVSSKIGTEFTTPQGEERLHEDNLTTLDENHSNSGSTHPVKKLQKDKKEVSTAENNVNVPKEESLSSVGASLRKKGGRWKEQTTATKDLLILSKDSFFQNESEGDSSKSVSPHIEQCVVNGKLLAIRNSINFSREGNSSTAEESENETSKSKVVRKRGRLRTQNKTTRDDSENTRLNSVEKSSNHVLQNKTVSDKTHTLLTMLDCDFSKMNNLNTEDESENDACQLRNVRKKGRPSKTKKSAVDNIVSQERENNFSTTDDSENDSLLLRVERRHRKISHVLNVPKNHDSGAVEALEPNTTDDSETELENLHKQELLRKNTTEDNSEQHRILRSKSRLAKAKFTSTDNSCDDISKGRELFEDSLNHTKNRVNNSSKKNSSTDIGASRNGAEQSEYIAGDDSSSANEEKQNENDTPLRIRSARQRKDINLELLGYRVSSKNETKEAIYLHRGKNKIVSVTDLGNGKEECLPRDEKMKRLSKNRATPEGTKIRQEKNDNLSETSKVRNLRAVDNLVQSENHAKKASAVYGTRSSMSKQEIQQDFLNKRRSLRIFINSTTQDEKAPSEELASDSIQRDEFLSDKDDIPLQERLAEDRSQKEPDKRQETSIDLSKCGNKKTHSNRNITTNQSLDNISDNPELKSVIVYILQRERNINRATYPKEYEVGDLAWAKLGSFPYWPCMVAESPEERKHKTVKTVIKREYVFYHIRFFGDRGRRAWVKATYILPFTGKNDMEIIRNVLREELNAPHYSKLTNDFKSNLQNWRTGAEEAEKLINSSVEERLDYFTRNFDTTIKRKSFAESSDDKVKESVHRRSRSLARDDFHERRKRARSLPITTNDSKSNHGRSTSRSPEKKKKKINNEEVAQIKSVEQSPKPEGVYNKRKSRTAEDSEKPGTSVTMKQKSTESSLKEKSNTMLNEDLSKSAKRMRHKIKLFDNLIYSDTDSKTSENSSVPTSLESHIAFIKKNNIFRGVPKEKVCQICLKPENIVRCKGKCNGVFHTDCIEELVKKQLKDLELIENNKINNTQSMEENVNQEDGELPVSNTENQDNQKEEFSSENGAVTPTVEIIDIKGASSSQIPNLAPMSPNFRKLTLAEQIDFKMKEIMDFNLDYLYPESADSSLDDISDNYLGISEDNDENSTDHSQKNDNLILKKLNKPPKKKVIRHVTADDVIFSTIESNESSKTEENQIFKQPFDRVNFGESESDKKGNDVKDYKCGFCTADIEPKCFVCRKNISKKGSTIRQMCSLNKCGRFYHPECLKMWPQTQWSIISTTKHRDSNRNLDTFVCPLHICHICASDDPRAANSRCPSDKLVKCLRCPASYHSTTHCVPAGTEILSSNQIICPRHYGEDTEGNLLKPMHVINTLWCFICSEGGDLICCETCPTSVHSSCLPVNLTEDNTFICEDCESGRFPLYDEIVWVKLGTYRWWPALILFPSEIPDNIRNLRHSKGEFVVKFFGTSDHYWVSRGRTFLFQEGDQGQSQTIKKRIDNAFARAVEEAAAAHEMRKRFKSTREAEKNNSLKPPPYIKIKSNKPVGNVRQVDFNASIATACDCDPSKPHPCGPDSDCLNRLLMTECNPEICPAGERCNNQCFEKREYPPMIPYKTEGRGWGLRTLAPIRKGQFVIEYVGELIDEQEYQRRIKKMHEQKEENYYFLTIDKDRMLDAGPKGNAARFMNHCCQPNCETQKWTVNGDTRVGLFANQDIPANSELTFNYNLECVGKELKVCKCGAPNCNGFIGVKTKSDESRKNKKIVPKIKKKKSNEIPKKNICFICGKFGSVGMCNNKICTKYFHLRCVGLQAWPEGGKWACPWHNCNVCSKRTIRCCVKCISSFCPSHSDGNIRYDNLLGFICTEHDPTKGQNEEVVSRITVKPSTTTTDETAVTSTTPDEIEVISSARKLKRTKRLISEGNFGGSLGTTATSTPLKKLANSSELEYSSENEVSSASGSNLTTSSKRKKGKQIKSETVKKQKASKNTSKSTSLSRNDSQSSTEAPQKNKSINSSVSSTEMN